MAAKFGGAVFIAKIGSTFSKNDKMALAPKIRVVGGKFFFQLKEHKKLLNKSANENRR